MTEMFKPCGRGQHDICAEANVFDPTSVCSCRCHGPKKGTPVLTKLDELSMQISDDMRACHEFYCKYNCGSVNPPGTHTQRCSRLRAQYDLPKYKQGMHMPPPSTK